MSSLNEESPQHHLHSANEPLPGSKSGVTTADYAPASETMNQSRLTPSEEGNAQVSGLTSHQDETAVKRSMSDKIIGKTQEIVGKVTRNSQLQEKGAERAHPKAST